MPHRRFLFILLLILLSIGEVAALPGHRAGVWTKRNPLFRIYALTLSDKKTAPITN